MALLAAITAATTGTVASTAEAQSEPSDCSRTVVRIVAKRVADGRTEFALQQDRGSPGNGDPDWGDRRRPARRFFPTVAEVDRWLFSAPLTVRAGEECPGALVRITARLLPDDRIEFGLRQGSGQLQLPTRRFFPSDARVGRWLASSPLTVDPTTEPNPTSGFQFQAVSAGFGHSCGLRTNGTIACWDDNAHGQTNAPDDQFTAVAAGGSHSCGLRTNTTGLRTSGTIACWGDNAHGQTNAPDDQFTAVAAGAWHTCGVRAAGAIACWGNNDFGQSKAPSGQFIAVSPGGRHTCGLRSDRTITCWGSSARGLADVPAGQFIAVTAGGSHSCGLHIDRTIAWLGQQQRRANGHTQRGVPRRHRRGEPLVRSAHDRIRHLLGAQ